MIRSLVKASTVPLRATDIAKNASGTSYKFDVECNTKNRNIVVFPSKADGL